MKKTVWTFGLISGGILSAMMLITLPFEKHNSASLVVGYTTMVLAFLLVYFGIQSYRDNVAGGAVGFGRAVSIGLLIMTIASVCYTATWEIIYFKFDTGFAEAYGKAEVDKVRASGAGQAAVDKKIADMQQFKKMYDNPLYNSALTFLEPLPVGVLIALVSAGVLSRKRRGSSGAGAVAAAS